MGVTEVSWGKGDADPFQGKGVSFPSPDSTRMDQLQAEMSAAAGRPVQLLSMVTWRRIWAAPLPGDLPLLQGEYEAMRVALREHCPDPDWGKNPRELRYERAVERILAGQDLGSAQMNDVLRWLVRTP